MINKQKQPRMLTPEELAQIVKILREAKQWSQEQLSDISGIHVRTIQRIEKGMRSSIDSRRALARAFEIEDIDAFNKPYKIPTAEEIQAEKERFNKENIILQVTVIANGRELAELVESTVMDMSSPAFEISREADECFAELIDYFRDYRDIADMYSTKEKLVVYEEMQNYIDALKKLGVSVCYSTRKIFVKSAPNADPLAIKGLYIVAFPYGKEPEEFATPREIDIGY